MVKTTNKPPKHFAYVDSALGRDSYEDKLSGHLIAAGCGRYEKNREDMFDVLESRVSFALANAERLEEANQGKTPADANPRTTVHKLVRELLPYIRTSIQ